MQILRFFAKALLVLAMAGQQAHAAIVSPGGGAVALPGTTVASDPTLAGTVLADTVTNWDGAIDPLYGFPGATGTLQSRVVQSDATGTLDFYWRLTVAPPSYPAYVPQQLVLSGLDLGSFMTGAGFDANYRLDGLGTTAPVSANAPDPSSFIFQFSLASFGPGSSSYFLVLRSNATEFASTALASVGTTTVSTYAPVAPVPEPGTYAMLLLGLAALGGFARRRQGAPSAPSA